MNRRFLLPLLMLALLCATSHAQTSKRELWSDIDKLGSNYYSYPGARYRQTPPPAGYEAFYISHFGRHGSRYLTSNNAYHRTIDLLEKAETQQALTRKGRKLLNKLRVAYADSRSWADANMRASHSVPAPAIPVCLPTAHRSLPAAPRPTAARRA